MPVVVNNAVSPVETQLIDCFNNSRFPAYVADFGDLEHSSLPVPEDLGASFEPVLTNGKPMNAKDKRDIENDRAARYALLDPAAVTQRLIKNFRTISSQVVGAEDLVNQSLFAFLAAEHQLLYSRAGVAKSLYARSIFDTFSGSKTFRFQLTKGTPEEAIIGPIDFAKLKQGNIWHNVLNSLADCEFAFLDELFDANDVTLRSTLGLLNERELIKGIQQLIAPLHSAIATTNYLRRTDVTEALLDRFIYRANLLPEKSVYGQLRIDLFYEKTGGTPVVLPQAQRMDYAELEFLNAMVEGRVEGKKIQAPRHVLFIKNLIINEYEERVNSRMQGQDRVYLSPRTIAKTRDLLNSSALLRGSSTIEAKDLANLRYLVPTLGHPEQQTAFIEVFKEIKAGLTKHDLRLIDALLSFHDILEDLIAGGLGNRPLPLNLLQRLMVFFSLTTPQKVTCDQMIDRIRATNTKHPKVQELKDGILHRIAAEKAVIDRAVKAA